MISTIKNNTFDIVSFDKIYEDKDKIYYRVVYKEFFKIFNKSEIVFVYRNFSPTYSFVADNKKFGTTYTSYYTYDKLFKNEIQRYKESNTVK